MSISDDEVEAAARAFDPFSFQSWQQSYDYEMAKSADAVEAKAFADWCMGKKIEEARTGARAALSAAAKVRAIREGDGEPIGHIFARVADKATIRIRPEVSGDAEYWRIREAIQTELAASVPALAASSIPPTGGEKE